MEQIVIADRTMARVLALLPGIVVVLAVRLLTLGQPPLALRVFAAAGIAAAAWIGYRLLTARVVVTDGGVTVRGVFHEGLITWTELETVELSAASRPLRALVWGIMQPHGLVLHGHNRTLRPVAAIGHADDDDLRRAIGAMRVRMGAWGVLGVQRTDAEPAATG